MFTTLHQLDQEITRLRAGQYGDIDNDATPIATALTTAGTFYKLSGDTVLHFGRDFDMPSDGRLRYTGTPIVMVMVMATFDFVSDTPNHCHMAVAEERLGIRVA